ncbi:membrane insertase OXA1 [Aspergillus lucknowensis]|uniref:60Kd inner membrane protein-domain-containing protein n=1 Tax=Aspergillus lucknowensis TaxID=176173 RepID=A0ABR4LG71_9EURO
MLGGPGLTGRIARQQYAAFTKPSRSMSSFRPQVSRLPVRPGKTLSGSTIWRQPVPSISGAAIRFNSTSSPPPPAPTGEVSPEVQPSNDFDIDLSNIDITSIPERIGYLKELGLDWGWGPSSMVQFVIEHIHIWSGLPWVGSMVATGFLFRFAMMPLFFRAADAGTKISNTRDLTSPIREKMVRFSREGNHTEAMKYRAELSKIHKDHDIKPMRAFIPMFAQLPVGIGCYRVISGMAHLPVPGLTAESFAWITDLTVSDPYFILPLAASVFLHLSLKKGGEFGNVDPSTAGLQKILRYAMPAITFVFCAFFPAALQLYFASTGLFACGQAFMLSNIGFRKFAGISIPGRYLESETVTADPTESGKTSSLRTLAAALEAERTKQIGGAAASIRQGKLSHAEQISFIDRALRSAKDTKDTIFRQTTEKIQEMTGNQAPKNADGTPAAPPRLSEKDRKLAEDYERRRKEEDEWKREERNYARREAYLQALEREREKARASSKSNKPKRR